LGSVVADRALPARERTCVRSSARRALQTGLRSRGIEALDSHQAEALDLLHAGLDLHRHPTASGHSLCYDLPVLQAVLDDPSARSTCSRLRPRTGPAGGLRAFAELAGVDLAAGIYDGDTAPGVRQTIRAAGQVVVTNPDMLHAAILPHHTKWYQLFEQLRFIVVDEAHTYRGVFGSHVANVLRRLLRLCAHYGSHPVIVTCSATIGNPQQLATSLTGVVPPSSTGTGAGRREARPHPQPAGRGCAISIRAGALRWPALRAGLLRADRQTIVFGASRRRGVDADPAPGCPSEGRGPARLRAISAGSADRAAGDRRGPAAARCRRGARTPRAWPRHRSA
jgi:DEAD/DEAH box helicase domain-containing protein